MELLDAGEDCLSLLVTASVSSWRHDGDGYDKEVFLLEQSPSEELRKIIPYRLHYFALLMMMN